MGTPATGTPATGTSSRYPEIADHGLIGDLQTAALVATDGTVDWFCCPRFDSPSVFASLLDADHGGYFRVGPDRDDYVTKQLYVPDTAILITRFLTPDGVGEVHDFMPVAGRQCHRRAPADQAAAGGPRHDAVRDRHPAQIRLRAAAAHAGAIRGRGGVPGREPRR